MMPPRSPLLLVATLLAAALAADPAPSAAQEREEILGFEVLVDVQPGGRLIVTEEITVRALGQEIRRGIYRDFPTSFPRWSALGRIEAPFEVRAVRRGGQAEPYAVMGIGGPIGRGGVRVRAGREDVFLDPGMHTYVFEYETDRWVTFGETEDQLFWNVTGNGWSFPINKASARIRIGELDSTPTLEAWTGLEGSTEQSAEAFWDPSAREASFRATRGLFPAEGLTVRVTFPSGQLTPPTEEQQEAWFALDWGGYVDAAYLVLLVIAVYMLMWRRVGVDPASGPTSLRTDPPDGLSPAALGYLTERGYEVNQLAAALVSMAMKGAIRVEQTGRSWQIHKARQGVDLAAEEREILQELLSARGSFELKQANHAPLKRAIRRLRGALSKQLEREYFVNNRRWFAAGLAVSVAGLAALAWRWRFGIEPVALFIGFWLTFWTMGVVTLLTRLAQTARQARKSPLLWIGVVFIALFALPFLGAELFVAGLFFTMVPSHLALAVIAVGATNVLFYHLLERPTLRGRGVLDQIAGFRAYLEGTRPKVDATVEHFERYLPHAIALGLEERWADGFGGALQPAAVTPGRTGTRPLDWFDHDGAGRMDASSFASSLGSSLSSTLSSSSHAPSSGGGGW